MVEKKRESDNNKKRTQIKKPAVKTNDNRIIDPINKITLFEKKTKKQNNNK